jgi:hypothetical protein
MQYAKIDQKNARKLIAISFRIFDKVLKYAGVQKVETACKIAKILESHRICKKRPKSMGLEWIRIIQIRQKRWIDPFPSKP